MQITRKDGITYDRKPQRGKDTIPSKAQYQETLTRLVTDKLFDVVLVVRMGCEMGMSRQDIVNAEIKNLDKKPRGLYVEKSKLVKRGGKYQMRSREIPINPNLYSFIQQYIDRDQKFILKKTREIEEPFKVLHVNELYNKGNVSWSPHKSRHYFRTQLKTWMRAQRSMDEELIDSLMGHQPRGARELYGVIDWSYKQEIVDKVFG